MKKWLECMDASYVTFIMKEKIRRSIQLCLSVEVELSRKASRMTYHTPAVTIAWPDGLPVKLSASRVFIAAHFPHQCFIGMTLGWLVAKKLNNITQQQVGTFLYCVITAGMLASALSMYAFLTAIGVDPMWSVGRAIKWCAKPEYVHLDTTPFFSMMRYCGFMFGMGFGFNSKSFKQNSKSRFTLAMKIACAIISVGVCKLSEKVALFKINMFLFYVQAFLLNALLSYVMIAAAPYIVSKIWNSNTKQKTK
ncbi:Glucose-6-phosphatase [Araneus ventricosus]|uniref:Glucose-6-phosphatase n=1 Tax=Araneus ventricosus TaxID=182803 RepID=A0A4Y2HRY7_ARAVE|nr:Glucose-6-phosphatase [Araneus ventricosus]